MGRGATAPRGAWDFLRDAVDRMGRGLLGADEYRRFQYKRARKIAHRYGYDVYKSQLIWQSDPEFLRIREEAARRGIVGIPNDRCYMLLEAARLTRRLSGDMAECGVRHGKSSLFLLSASDKRLHAFDSFAGLSAPTAADRGADGKTSWTSGELAVAETVFLANLRGFEERIALHTGWIPERFADVAASRFCLVHIDVDLYEPTRDSVQFFYERTVPGGFIICDDYGSAYCPGAKKAIDEFFADKPEPVLALTTGQSLVIKHQPQTNGAT
jgi:O-methyltransferase